MINARARKAMKGKFWDNVELIDPNEVKLDAGKSDLEEDSGDDSELDSNSSDDSNLKQSKESSSKKTEDKAPNITYNIQNISIHDSVVIDSDLSSGEE